MKKVRITLKRGAAPWSFTLYDSSESAYYLKDEPPYPDGFEEEYRKIISLKYGEILEAEWIGSEWVFAEDHSDFLQKPIQANSHEHDKYDKVRVGKITPTKGSEEKLGYLEVYSGWTFGGGIPWSQKTARAGIKVIEIKDNLQSKFDFQKLFSDPTMGLLQQLEEEQPLSNVLS